MSKASKLALSYFDSADTATPKLNCGQSVLAGLGFRIGIDEITATRCGRGFGGGIGHQGDVCGALCGAVIALGFGHDGKSEGRNRSATYGDARKLFQRFRQRHGNTECRLLIGVDPSTPEGEHEVHARNIHQTHCTQFVASAVEIVEDLLAEARQAEAAE